MALLIAKNNEKKIILFIEKILVEQIGFIVTRHRSSGNANRTGKLTVSYDPEMILQEQVNMIARHLLFNSAYDRNVTMLRREVGKNDIDMTITGVDTSNTAVTLMIYSKRPLHVQLEGGQFTVWEGKWKG